MRNTLIAFIGRFPADLAAVYRHAAHPRNGLASRARRPVASLINDGWLGRIAAGCVVAVKIESEQAEHRDHEYQNGRNDEAFEKNHDARSASIFMT